MKSRIPTPLQQEHEVLQDELSRATQADGERAARSDIVSFAYQRLQHARTEEAVMYPAAVCVGHQPRPTLGQRADSRVST